MKIKTTLALAAIALAAASPAFAKASIQKGQAVCKAAILAQTPAPKGASVDTDATRVSNETLTYSFRVTDADGKPAKIGCTVDRDTNEAKVVAAAAPTAAGK